MFRIDTDGSINSHFSDGDATGSEPKHGTVLSAEWLNAVQDSLCTVIEDAGLQLDKNQHWLLKNAIWAMIDSKTKSLEDEIKKIKESIGI